MIILTTFSIGMLIVGMRSVVCCAYAGCLIVIVFALAAVVSAGPVSLAALATALLAYNVGIASTVVIAFVLAPRLRA